MMAGQASYSQTSLSAVRMPGGGGAFSMGNNQEMRRWVSHHVMRLCPAVPHLAFKNDIVCDIFKNHCNVLNLPGMDVPFDFSPFLGLPAQRCLGPPVCFRDAPRCPKVSLTDTCVSTVLIMSVFTIDFLLARTLQLDCCVYRVTQMPGMGRSLLM
jgi:hypothetical protein